MIKLPPEAQPESIGPRIKAVRKLFDETQEVFANRIGVSRDRLKNWEGGSKRPSMDAAVSICAESGVTLDYIFLGRWNSLSTDLRKRLEVAST